MASKKTSRLSRVRDMAIAPAPELYSPPPEEECETYPIQTTPTPGEELYAVQRVHRGKIVHFALSQRIYCARCQAWHTIRRVDTTHGTVHEHKFRHGEDEGESVDRITHLADIPPNEAGWDVVTAEFEDQWNRIVDTWDAYRRSWGDLG